MSTTWTSSPWTPFFTTCHPILRLTHPRHTLLRVTYTTPLALYSVDHAHVLTCFLRPDATSVSSGQNPSTTWTDSSEAEASSLFGSREPHHTSSGGSTLQPRSPRSPCCKTPSEFCSRTVGPPLRCLRATVRIMAEGNIPSPIVSCIASASVTALNKKDCSHQRVAAGETLRRLTAKALFAQFPRT